MKPIHDQNKINQLLTRGVENVYPTADFLRAKLMGKEPLTLYLGIDPTGPTLHLGHAINLRKLKLFQELGHKVVLLIGDFTGTIGDPTDKSATRQMLTRKQVLANCKLYKKQASKFISFSGKNSAIIKFNSKWLAKMSFVDVVGLASNFTVQQMLERDMFQKRMSEGKPIHLHEFLYPLMQAYDSVAMDVDGEIGGNDQTFNMLAGRDLMKILKKKEKFVMTMKLLTDPTGKKMGKSEGNMITLMDSADEMFGKIMSWPDEMIDGGFELITDVASEEITALKKEMANPRDQKARLAFEVVKIFHSEKAATEAQANFDKMFRDKEIPEEISEVKISGSMNVIDVLVETKLAASKGEARRLIDGGGVKVDGEVVKSYDFVVPKGIVVQKGKRGFVRVVR
ncbi:MAG: tyrosine--tRNA ligase [Patescibacteria group bacterium]|jgi:tyrosyl-tRNA synthetase